MTRDIRLHTRIPRRSVADGLSIAQLHREHLPDHLDPFLGFDHFEMAQPFFPPHPHAGFSAVTYMFPQSANGFVNRDSLGDRSLIEPGALHWTAAGSGVVHEEVPIVRGTTCHGLQIFVDLPAAAKWMAPRSYHLAPDQIPVVDAPGSRTRVVFGRHGDVRAAFDAPTEVTLLDVVLAPHAMFEHAPPSDERRFLYVIGGALSDGLAVGDAVGYADGDAPIRVRAGDGGAHVVVAGGRPLAQPTVFHGPFCMTSRADIDRAITRYQTGAMGHLAASF